MSDNIGINKFQSTQSFDQWQKPRRRFYPETSSDFQNGNEKEGFKVAEDSKNSTKNSSTLSLHIAAYENSNKAATASDNGLMKDASTKMPQEMQRPKQSLVGCSSLSQDPWNAPRQQLHAENQMPEIAPFKKSQRLFNPNKFASSSLYNYRPRSSAKFSRKSQAKDVHEEDDRPFRSGFEILMEELEKFGFENLQHFEDWFLLEKMFQDFSHVKGRKPKFISVAEKTSLAKDIANTLSKGKFKEYRLEADGNKVETKPSDATEKKNEDETTTSEKAGIPPGKKHNDDEMPYLTVFEFSCILFGIEVDMVMCATNGHLCSETFNINDEDVESGKEFFHHKIYKELIRDGGIGKKFYPFWFEKLSNGADGMVLFLDLDEEGESIAFEVIEMTKKHLNIPPTGFVLDAVYRASFYSTSVTQIENAIKTLRRPDIRKHLAMLAKHYLDLIIGRSFTKHQKQIIRGALKNRDIKLLQFGPCQTTALKIIVDQFRFLKNYVPKYVIELAVSLGNGGSVKALSPEFNNEKDVAKICQLLREYRSCEVVQVSEKIVTKYPPNGLATMDFYQMISDQLHINPSDAMLDAESLYIGGYITYPRTSSTQFPEDLDVLQLYDEMIELFTDQDGKVSISREDIQSNIQDVINGGIAVGNHVPIMPTGRTFSKEFIKSRKGRVFSMICKYFFASFMKPYEYLEESVIFDIGDGYQFRYTANKLINAGFTKILPFMKVEESKCSKKFQLGQRFFCSTNFVPVPAPRLLTESMLIQKMAEYSIGTDGSVPEHIKHLVENKFVVTIDKYGFSRQYQPTVLGLQLIEHYEESIPEFIEPAFRAQFMTDISKIASGDAEFEKVYDKYLNMIYNFYQKFVEKFQDEESSPETLSKMQEEFQGCFRAKPIIEPPEPLNHDPKLNVLLE